MKLGNKITLSQHDGNEVKRKLSYLDFVARRSFALPADDDNIVATLYAISLLTGRTIGVDTIRTIITNADSDAPMHALCIVAIATLPTCCNATLMVLPSMRRVYWTSLHRYVIHTRICPHSAIG